MKNQQSGFTLIELIMVIVILGILAAFALPKFADLSGDAKVATIHAATGSMRSASAIVHSAYLAKGTNPTSVTLEGTVITVTNGYPDVAGMLLAAQISSGDYETGTAGTVAAKGTLATGTCKVVYTAATSAGTPAVVTPPTFTETVSGC
jgi:MSHA pilin protein MshA